MKWTGLIKQNNGYGSKEIRCLPNGNGIYSWLYRHDRPWLLQINNSIKKPLCTINKRVNWQQRDLLVVKQLIKLQKRANKNLNTPWQSKKWFLNKLKNKSTIEKNISRLPLCQAFFVKYVESLDQYQLRRCFVQVIHCIKTSQPIREWEIARISGLDNNRVLPVTKKIFTWNRGN